MDSLLGNNAQKATDLSIKINSLNPNISYSNAGIVYVVIRSNMPIFANDGCCPSAVISRLLLTAVMSDAHSIQKSNDLLSIMAATCDSNHLPHLACHSSQRNISHFIDSSSNNCNADRKLVYNQ